MIAVVINALMWRQVIVVHDFVDSITLDPKNVPILTKQQQLRLIRLPDESTNLLLNFLVAAFFEGIEDAILEARLEFDGRAV